MSESPSIYALVPAAGRSVRMGRQKLALPLGSKLVLERVLQSLAIEGVDGVLVVLGPESAGLAMHALAGVDSLLLEQQTADMRATLERGLDWLEAHRRPKPSDGVLVALGDQPTVESALVQGLIDEYRGGPGGIVLPTYGGRRGHPVIVAWRWIINLRHLPGDQGLNGVIDRHSSEVRELTWSSSRILDDLDTPSQFEGLKKLPWD